MALNNCDAILGECSVWIISSPVTTGYFSATAEATG